MLRFAGERFFEVPWIPCAPSAFLCSRMSIAFRIITCWLLVLLPGLLAATGLVLALMLGVTTYYRAKKGNYPKERRATWGERWTAFRESISR